MPYLALEKISDRHGHTAAHDVVDDKHPHVNVHPDKFVHLAADDPRAAKPGPAAQYGRHNGGGVSPRYPRVEQATAAPGEKRGDK